MANEDNNEEAAAAAADDEEEWKDDDFLSLSNPKEETNKNQVAEAFVSEGYSARCTNVTGISSSDLPPWMDQYTDFRRVSPLVALHNEIVGFCDLMSPMPKEMEQRDALVERFKELAYKTFGKDKCQVAVFGSQATGLCLPSSDIDIVIQLADEEEDKDKQGDNTKKASKGIIKKEKGKGDGNNNNIIGEEKENDEEGEIDNNNEEEEHRWDQMRVKNPLDRLADALREEWNDQLSYLEVIAKTKVPLVKFTHQPTGIDVDVSFLKETGTQAATLMKTFMEAMPPLRPLIFVLKYFLAARVLNEPYSGGVGSYMLQLMIVSFLQHREREAINLIGKSSLYNLGGLLVEFLELYGTKFNSCTTVISVRHDGSYFRKAENKDAFFNPQRPSLMAIENPLDITADVGKASFRISMVQRAFAAAYKVLLAHVASPVEPTISVLATIIPPSEEMVQRKALKGSGIKAAQIQNKLNGSLQSGRGDSPRKKKRRLN